MPSSMTGFGAGEAERGGWHYSVQLKSVNNRFLELNLKLPPTFWAQEADLRGRLQKALARGKVDLFWKERAPERAGSEVQLNAELAKAYQGAFTKLGQELKLSGELRLEHFIRLPELLQLGGAAESSEADRWGAFQAALDLAIQALLESRRREGKALEIELRALIQAARGFGEGIAARSHAMLPQIQERLKARLKELLQGALIYEGRFLNEVALMSERSDIREETVRFGTHLAEFERLLGQNGAIGKQLDFLSQELLRETNTMGSKSPDAELTQQVVSLKAEIEKIKEQIQNVE
jgi:uncharacterized protein (TIGR00255 family)